MKFAIWQDCSSSKYTSIDGVGFLIRRHTFKTTVITSFHAERCCHLYASPAYAAASAAAGCPLAIMSTDPGP